MPYFLIFIGCLGLAISTIGVFLQDIQQLDIAAVIWMSLHRSNFFNEIAIFLSKMGGLPSMIILCGFSCLYFYKSKRYAYILFVSLSLVGGSMMGWMLKFLFNRPRPSTMYQMVETYGASFPSAHSLYASLITCLLLFIFYKHTQAKLIIFFACIWSLMMGISRVYVGAHFPTDVLAGWSIAIIWVSVLWLILAPKILSEKHLFLENNLKEVK